MRKWIALALVAVVVPLCGAGPRQNADGFGVGAHPVNDSVASAWFTQSVSSETRTLAFLVYVKGKPGWVDGGTKWDWDLGDPAHSEFVVGAAHFRLEVSRSESRGRIFTHDAPLSEANVVVVSEIDSPSPIIAQTFHFDLTVPASTNPAVYLIQSHPALRLAVLSEP